MFDDLVFIAQISLKSSVAVMIAALGEIYAERSGVLNLGVEGMMLVGALTGFAVGLVTGNPYLALAGAMAAGGLLALLHGFFVITLRGNQVLSGLALTVLGVGLTSFLGRPLIDDTGLRLKAWAVPGLSKIPFFGDVFFNQNPLVYLALILVPLGSLILFRTTLGLKIRAVGEDAAAADAAGVGVSAIRYGCTVTGGLLAGLAGSYMSLAYTPGWKENMTAGQGWIAIGMVIFATWKPGRGVFRSLAFRRTDGPPVLFSSHGGGSTSGVCPAYAALSADHSGSGHRHPAREHQEDRRGPGGPGTAVLPGGLTRGRAVVSGQK